MRKSGAVGGWPPAVGLFSAGADMECSYPTRVARGNCCFLLLFSVRVIFGIDVVELKRRFAVDLHDGFSPRRRVVVHVGIQEPKTAGREGCHLGRMKMSPTDLERSGNDGDAFSRWDASAARSCIHPASLNARCSHRSRPSGRLRALRTARPGAQPAAQDPMECCSREYVSFVRRHVRRNRKELTRAAE